MPQTTPRDAVDRLAARIEQMFQSGTPEGVVLAEVPDEAQFIVDASEVLFDPGAASHWLRAEAGSGLPQDLGRIDTHGVSCLAGRLRARFIAQAPRAIFDLTGRATDTAGEADVLCRVIEQVCDGSVLFHPGSDREIDEIEARIVRALDGLGQRAPHPNAVACLDAASDASNAAIRARAAREGGLLVTASGGSDLALTFLNDPDPDVRIAWVEGAAPSAAAAAQEVAEAAHDIDAEVRRAALTALAEAGVRPAPEWRLDMRLFDPSTDVREQAARLFSAPEARRAARLLVAQVARCEPVGAAELRAVAAGGASEAPARVFAERLRGLDPLSDADDAAMTVRACAQMRTGPSDELMQEIERHAAAKAGSALDRALVALFAQYPIGRIGQQVIAARLSWPAAREGAGWQIELARLLLNAPLGADPGALDEVLAVAAAGPGRDMLTNARANLPDALSGWSDPGGRAADHAPEGGRDPGGRTQR